MSEKKRGRFKKFLLILFLLIVLIGFILFITRSYLYLQFLLVEDVLVKVESFSPYLELQNGDTQDIGFKFTTTSNILCKVECTIKFRNLDKNTYDETKAIVTPKISQKREYTIQANQEGYGIQFYRFDISCNSLPSFFCPTTSSPSKRSSLTVINHTLNNAQILEKNAAEGIINYLVNKSNNLKYKQEIISLSLAEINQTVNIDNESDTLQDTNDKFKLYEQQINELQDIWMNQKYSEINQKISLLKDSYISLETSFNKTNIKETNLINGYNFLANKLDKIYNSISEISNKKIDNESDKLILNNLISDYNNLMSNISKRDFIDKKDTYITAFETNNLINLNQLEKYTKENNLTNFSNIKLPPIKAVALNISNFSKYEFNFRIELQCCLYGQCKACCVDEFCRNNESTYPILLLHGHQIVKQSPAEFSLESLNKIQESLEEYGYFNGGTTSLVINKEDIEQYSYIDAPVTFRGSYYFDLFNDPENPVVVPMKSDNIDTYAIRLKDLVEGVKERTQRQKVVLVGYSMGGLVVRRYVQLFGENDVDKIILIATPNHGIGENLADFCGVVGESSHCNDMQESSVFMSKLNNKDVHKIPVYNLIGVGCNTLGEEGDGIVTNKSAYLSWAKNIYIAGNCKNVFDPLHAQIADPSKYVQTLKEIVKILKNES